MFTQSVALGIRTWTWVQHCNEYYSERPFDFDVVPPTARAEAARCYACEAQIEIGCHVLVQSVALEANLLANGTTKRVQGGYCVASWRSACLNALASTSDLTLCICRTLSQRNAMTRPLCKNHAVSKAVHQGELTISY